MNLQKQYSGRGKNNENGKNRAVTLKKRVQFIVQTVGGKVENDLRFTWGNETISSLDGTPRGSLTGQVFVPPVIARYEEGTEYSTNYALISSTSMLLCLQVS